jgi:hypothetical protein
VHAKQPSVWSTSVLKRIVRRGVREVRQWLREEEALQDPKWLLDSDFVCDHQNYRLLQLLKQHPDFRPHFTWGVLYGANLAKCLGIRRISVIEFGVAGGNGLVSLEAIASAVGELFGIEIDVYGFDTGQGLPKPEDYRDQPNLYREAGFPMDEEKLRKRLRKARLILGDVGRTIGSFVESRPASVAFVSIDVDLYTSTMGAFRLFEAGQEILLPRVYCYFDDILGETFSEFTGERLAIAEFNERHKMRKISPIFGLRYFLHPPHNQEAWAEQMFIAHMFDHELYGHWEGSTKDAGGWTELQAKG